MLSDEYLTKGLTALSRAWTQKSAMVGHTGAAVIAAYFFCRENELEDRTQELIDKLVDNLIEQNGAFWDKNAKESDSLFAPYSKEPHNPELLADIISALDQKIAVLRSSGHCTIFASLALKGLKQIPQMITPSVVDGICKLILKFGDSPGQGYYGKEKGWLRGIPVEPEKHLSPYKNIHDVIKAAFHEIITHDRIKQRGYGSHLHLTTHTNALLELDEMGYSELSQKGYHAHQTHIMLLRSLPPDTLEHDEIKRFEPAKFSPLTYDYWNTYDPTQEQKSALQLGGADHVLKISYAFFHILKSVSNVQKQETYLQQLGYVT